MNATPRKSIEISLLEDHQVVREGIRLILEAEHDMTVTGEAGTLAEALADQHSRTVNLVDLMLPDASGPEIVTSMCDRFPDSVTVVLSMSATVADLTTAMAAGARGYLIKEATPSELVEAVRLVAGGGEYVHPSLGAMLARSRDREAPVGRNGRLTAREAEVLGLLAVGHTNVEIASILGIATRTVEAHRAHIMQKTGTRNRAQLVRRAIDEGLVNLNQ